MGYTSCPKGAAPQIINHSQFTQGQQLKATEAQLEAVQQEVSKLRNSLAVMASREAKSDAALTSKQEQLRQIEERIQQAHDEERTLKQKIEQLMQQTVTQSMQSMQHMVDDLVQRQEQEKRMYEMLIQEQEKAREQHRKAVEAEKQEIAELDEEIESRASKLEQVQNNLIRSKQQLRDMEKRRTGLMEVISDLEALAGENGVAKLIRANDGISSSPQLSPATTGKPNLSSPTHALQPQPPSSKPKPTSATNGTMSPRARSRASNGSRTQRTQAEQMAALFGQHAADELLADDETGELLVDQDLIDTLQGVNVYSSSR